MKQDTPISLESWHELIALAQQFADLSPWKWMRDSDLFGVEMSALGEVGYCSIVEGNGVFSGLEVYMGDEGLHSFQQWYEMTLQPDPYDSLFFKNCLSLTYESKNALFDQELELFKMLGDDARTAKGWPVFRNRQVGYFPYLINTQQEADCMKAAIEQSIEVAIRCKNKPQTLTGPENMVDSVLVRRFHKGLNGSFWKDEWQQPNFVAPEKPPVIPEHQKEAVIAHYPLYEEVIWMVDVSFLPRPINDEHNLPFFPRMMIVVDLVTGEIMSHELFPPDQAHAGIFQSMLALFEQLNYRAGKVLVSNQQSFDWMNSVCESFEMELHLDEENHVLQNIRQWLWEQIMKEGEGESEE